MANFVPVKLSYNVFEPKDGTDPNLSPIIFMHGLTGVKEMWENIPQIIADKTKRKAFAYDCRNHGDSEFTDVFNFDLNVDDLFHFMDTKNIKKAVLVGHSMGALTATNAALRKPERIEMVFSEDMFVNKLPQEIWNALLPLLKMRRESAQAVPSELKEEEAGKFANNYFINMVPDSSPLFIGMKKEDLRKLKIYLKRKPEGGYDLNCNVDVLFDALNDAETLMTNPVGQFNGPAYFIYGTHSFLQIPTHEESIKKHFPKAELIEIEGATHNVHPEFPEKFTETLLNRLWK